MTSPYLGEIRMFGGNFAPSQNALCQGQLLSIQQNTALFSLLGTYYGGNGVQNFALPDFRGRLPINQGQGNGLSNYTIGQIGGSENVTLLQTQMPNHNHSMLATSAGASQPSPKNNIPASMVNPITGFWVSQPTGSPIQMNPASLGMTGGGQPHENRMPIVAFSFIIALNGIYPSRS